MEKFATIVPGQTRQEQVLRTVGAPSELQPAATSAAAKGSASRSTGYDGCGKRKGLRAGMVSPRHGGRMHHATAAPAAQSRMYQPCAVPCARDVQLEDEPWNCGSCATLYGLWSWAP